MKAVAEENWGEERSLCRPRLRTFQIDPKDLPIRSVPG
jgi:hypothetical protein